MTPFELCGKMKTVELLLLKLYSSLNLCMELANIGCDLKMVNEEVISQTDLYMYLVSLSSKTYVFEDEMTEYWSVRPVISFCVGDLQLYVLFNTGRVAQSVGHLTRKSGVLGSIPGLATYFRFSFRFFKKGSCQLLAEVCARSTG